MSRQFIVLVSNSYHQAQVFGPFKTEAAADKWGRKMSKQYLSLDFLTLPIYQISTLG